MRIEVNGVRLYFDTYGSGLEPDGPAMRAKPTLILLHGGPGMDHASYKPDFYCLGDVAQVVFLDHRGNGRSDDGPLERHTLAQWGDDVAAFCDALEIEAPIVYGLSFGGFVAQSVATRHPDRLSGLILASTSARTMHERKYEAFERLGGPDARAAAERFWGGGIEDPGAIEAWERHCVPHYNTTPRDPVADERTIFRARTMQHFFRSGGERDRMNFLPDLARVAVPTLVLAGTEDPVATIPDMEEIRDHLPAELVRYHAIAGTGHGTHRDAPEETFRLIREFVREVGSAD